MSDSIEDTFRKLIEKYETAKAEDGAAGEDLLTSLVSDLCEEAADHWYSSSANC